MNFLKLVLILGLISLFACDDEGEFNRIVSLELETPCTAELIFIDTDRLNEITLTATQIPVTIREFIAAMK